jgi:peptide deformylase
MKDLVERILAGDEHPQSVPVVTDKLKLKQESDPVTEEDNVERIAATLFRTLSDKGGVGISAPQIGIQKRICVVNVQEPFYLVNPRIVDQKRKARYVEGCLSFPNEQVETRRNQIILVESDNYDSRIRFGPTPDNELPDMENPQLLESVAVQHEIDHLNGTLMFDRRMRKGNTYEKSLKEKIGRNDRVVIVPTKEADTEQSGASTLKYKHAKGYLENGWQLIDVAE